MNKTKIEWCDSTWNPVTGCLHGCEYCYARKIALRFSGASETHYNPTVGEECQWETEATGENHDLSEPVYDVDRGHNAPYPFGFDPTFHRYRLGEPAQKTRPQTIFVCSMADLFGDWVPDEWIREVFKACEAAPQHRFLFLTKNQKRYETLLDKYTPPNMWFGWSQTGPTNPVIRFTTHHSVKTFISIEPLLKPFNQINVIGLDWVIVGAETGNRKGKVIPKREWIDKIVESCDAAGTPVFMKDSLLPIMGEENMRREFPWNKEEKQC